MHHKSITPDMKMAGLVHMNPLLLPVINRFGIRLGFGDRSIDEVCRDSDVNTAFFLEIVNAFSHEKYFPEKHLQEFDARMIINYLYATHQYYQEIKVPELQTLIKTLVETTGPEYKNTAELLNGFFKEYVTELNEHLHLEEQQTFPYVLWLQNFVEGKAEDSANPVSGKDYKIYHFVEEHSNLEDKLLDLKNIIIKYIPSPLNSNLCNKILEGLFQLETDLRDHAWIEDKVLVPKVRMMEKKLNSKKSKRHTSKGGQT
jgi:regulator of cell morphogenesis and NO signaling